VKPKAKPNTNIRYLLFVICYLFTDYWSLVTGHWSLITGHWSLITGHWSLITVKDWVKPSAKPNGDAHPIDCQDRIKRKTPTSLTSWRKF